MLQPLKRLLLVDDPSADPDEFQAAVLDLALQCDMAEVQYEEELLCWVLIGLVEKMDGQWSERYDESALDPIDGLGIRWLKAGCPPWPEELTGADVSMVMGRLPHLVIELAMELSGQSRHAIVDAAEMLVDAVQWREAFERGEVDQPTRPMKCRRCDSTEYGGLYFGVVFCPAHYSEALELSEGMKSALGAVAGALDSMRTVIDAEIAGTPHSGALGGGEHDDPIVVRLETAEMLRQRGVLTDAEYVKKRQQLLDLL